MVNTRSGAGGEASGSRNSRQPRDPRPRPGPNPAHGMEPLPLAVLLTNLTLHDKEVTKLLVLSSWFLLEDVERLVQPIDM